MTEEKTPDPPFEGARKPLITLAVLGAASALWAVFLWRELINARRGGTAFCVFGEADCGLLWDAGFAATIHGLTGLPVAAWGLVWGLVALALPIMGLSALSQARATSATLGGVRWTAVAGLVGVVVLLVASASEGLFCSSCALTYVFTLAYGAVALLMRPRALPGIEGLGKAAVATLGAFLLLLYPGLQTPKSRASQDRELLADAAERQARKDRADEPAPKAQESGSTTSAARASSSEGDSPLDVQLRELLENQQPQFKLAISTALDLYRKARFHEEPPRALQGSAEALVRVTEFTDPLCGHCASLYAALEQIKGLVPPSTFNVDPRYFPLDGNCNNRLEIRGPESVRCLAVRAQICMEATPHAHNFSGAVFQNQRDLTPDRVYELAAPFMPRPELEACVASDETRRKLESDVDYAWHFEPGGTPLVLINGKEVSGLAMVPFVYTMILAGGNEDHPAFATLPPPDLDAFQSSHDGHQH